MRNIKQIGASYGKSVISTFDKKGIGATIKRVSRGARHLQIGVQLHNTIQVSDVFKLDRAICLDSGSKQVRVEIDSPLVYFEFELPEGNWKLFDRSALSGCGIGVSRVSASGNDTVDFELSDNAPHSLVVGSTGSGKTEAIKSAIVALCSVFSPKELGLGIVDIKRSKFAEFTNVAHMIAPIAIDSGEIENLIAWFGEQLDRRMNNGIFDDKKLLLVLDEAQDVTVLGTKPTALNQKNQAIVERLVKLGREFNIHVLIGTQETSRADLPNILDQLANRFAGRLVDAKASVNATGIPQLAAHKLTGQGDFLHVSPFGVQRFQVAMATQADYDTLPRGEILPVVAEIKNDFAPMPKKAGRPKLSLKIDPCKLARYHHTTIQGQSVSRTLARSWSIKQKEHEYYLEQYQKFIDCLKGLENE